MSMSRKDFALIAGVVAELPLTVRRPLARIFAYRLKTVYPHFDEEKFLGACDLDEGRKMVGGKR